MNILNYNLSIEIRADKKSGTVPGSSYIKYRPDRN